MSQTLQVYRMRVLVSRSCYRGHTVRIPDSRVTFSRAIDFIDQLPMTVTGKIRRRALRDRTVTVVVWCRCSMGSRMSLREISGAATELDAIVVGAGFAGLYAL